MKKRPTTTSRAKAPITKGLTKPPSTKTIWFWFWLLGTSGFVATAHSQSGNLRYAPASAVGVPAIGETGLVLTTLLLLICGLVFARRMHGNSKTVVSLAMLLSALSSLIISGSLLQGELAQARVAVTTVNLDQPAGGVVTIPSGQSEFKNTTTITLQVISLSSPCSNGAPNTASSNACAVGINVQAGGTCDASYSC